MIDDLMITVLVRRRQNLLHPRLVFIFCGSLEDHPHLPGSAGMRFRPVAALKA